MAQLNEPGNFKMRWKNRQRLTTGDHSDEKATAFVL